MQNSVSTGFNLRLIQGCQIQLWHPDSPDLSNLSQAARHLFQRLLRPQYLIQQLFFRTCYVATTCHQVHRIRAD